MNGTERRHVILDTLQNSDEPISGSELAKKLNVSRQIIVQDIALLRASELNIVATSRGYVIVSSKTCKRVVKVCHTDEEIEDELNCIVDLGGNVLDVFVNHKIYGQIHAEMNIRSRRNVQEFIANIKAGKSSPLKNITAGYHYHTLEADSEKTLDLIEDELKQKRFLVPPKNE